MLRHLLGIALCLSLPFAYAANNRATDAAFSALLSMPGAEPENGSWGIPALEDFTAKDEKTLIAYLARQQKAGGDFNAYRHHGTLLHHAIRARKSATALWLLEHGADPRLTAEGSDALALSVRYKLPQVHKALLEKYGVSPPKPLSPAAAAAAARPLPPPPFSSIQVALQKYAKSPAALDKAFAELPEGLLTEYYELALAELVKYGSVPAESWRVMWRRLGKRQTWEYEEGLAARMPYEQWPALIAAGYRNDSAERALGCLVARTSASDLKAKWTALEKNFPDFRQVAARLVLQSYRIPTHGHGCTSSEIIVQHDSASEEEELIAKLDWLRMNGIKGEVTGIPPDQFETYKPGTKLALQAFIAKPADKPRFSSVKPQCEFTLDDIWLKRFATAEVPPYEISLVEIPGDKQCAVLAGWQPRSEYSSGDTDNFTGPTWEGGPSCPDPKEHLVLWRRTKDGVVTLEHEIELSSLNFPAPVRDNVSGRIYYLDNGERAGKCTGGMVLPFFYEWQQKSGQRRLAASQSRELEEAMFAQCSAVGVDNCKGISWPADGDPYFHQYYRDFLLQYGAEGRAEYLAAVMALDKDKLQKIEAGPLPSIWVGDAITEVGKSELPLADKRKRIAHLFYDHELLGRAMEDGSSMVESLVAWLPAEDWGPILGLMRKYPYRYYPPGVLSRAKELDKKRLACDLENMLGSICGETRSE